MKHHEKIEVSSVRVSEDQTSTTYLPQCLPTLVEQQTRTRRLFAFPQLFAFALMYVGTWYAVAM